MIAGPGRAGRRSHRIRGRADRRPAARAHRGGRPRPHVPARPRVRQPERARQRADRRTHAAASPHASALPVIGALAELGWALLGTAATRRAGGGAAGRGARDPRDYSATGCVPRMDRPAYSLSYANRRRVEIARALMLRPKLLLLDEPTAGMNQTETAEMLELIRMLKGRGSNDPADRAQARSRHAAFRPRRAMDDGAQDRRGPAGRGAQRPCRHRRLSRQQRGRRQCCGAPGACGMTAALARSSPGIDTFYGPVQVHFGLNIAGSGRADRLPARRQRERQVDDDEDHPRPAAPARRAGHVRRARHHRPADARRSSAAASARCPRRGVCSGR